VPTTFGKASSGASISFPANSLQRTQRERYVIFLCRERDVDGFQASRFIRKTGRNSLELHQLEFYTPAVFVTRSNFLSNTIHHCKIILAIGSPESEKIMETNRDAT
jgi:hypothetical protein